MHKAGFAHSDVKLDNIMINNQGEFKLVDFGTLTDLRQLKDGKTTEKKGTFTYMCPNLLKNYTEKPTEYQPVQADMFALGVTLILLKFGEFPFSYAQNSDIQYMNIIGRENIRNQKGEIESTGDDSFWTIFEGFGVSVSQEFKALIIGMLEYHQAGSLDM